MKPLSHSASEKNAAGEVELGFTVADVEAFYREMSSKGVLFSMHPRNRISALCWPSLSILKGHIAGWARKRRSRQRLAAGMKWRTLMHVAHGKVADEGIPCGRYHGKKTQKIRIDQHTSWGAWRVVAWLFTIGFLHLNS